MTGNGNNSCVGGDKVVVGVKSKIFSERFCDVRERSFSLVSERG